MNRRKRKREEAGQASRTRDGKRYSQFEKRCRKRDKTVYAEEMWNLDTSLALFILPRLKEFRKGAMNPESCQGHPGNISYEENPDFPEKSSQEYLQLTMDESQAKWISYLDKMIWSFEYTIWEGTHDPSGLEFDFGKEELVYCGSDFNYEKFKIFSNIMNTRYQEGMDLFAKNFRGLWW